MLKRLMRRWLGSPEANQAASDPYVFAGRPVVSIVGCHVISTEVGVQIARMTDAEVALLSAERPAADTIVGSDVVWSERGFFALGKKIARIINDDLLPAAREMHRAGHCFGPVNWDDARCTGVRLKIKLVSAGCSSRKIVAVIPECGQAIGLASWVKEQLTARGIEGVEIGW